MPNLNPEDLKIEVVDYTPPGGQSVGKITHGVKVTHPPSGLTAISENERSQAKNKQVCIAMIESGLLEIEYHNQGMQSHLVITRPE